MVWGQVKIEVMVQVKGLGLGFRVEGSGIRVHSLSSGFRA
jgi:hypothetical protein